MPLTLQDHKIIRKIVKEELSKELSNYATRAELQEMLKAIDERFNEMEAKMIDKNDLYNKLDSMIYQMQTRDYETTATSQLISENEEKTEKINDRVKRLEILHKIELGLAV